MLLLEPLGHRLQGRGVVLVLGQLGCEQQRRPVRAPLGSGHAGDTRHVAKVRSQRGGGRLRRRLVQRRSRTRRDQHVLRVRVVEVGRGHHRVGAPGLTEAVVRIGRLLGGDGDGQPDGNQDEDEPGQDRAPRMGGTPAGGTQRDPGEGVVDGHDVLLEGSGGLMRPAFRRARSRSGASGPQRRWTQHHCRNRPDQRGWGHARTHRQQDGPSRPPAADGVRRPPGAAGDPGAGPLRAGRCRRGARHCLGRHRVAVRGSSGSALDRRPAPDHGQPRPRHAVVLGVPRDASRSPGPVGSGDRVGARPDDVAGPGVGADDHDDRVRPLVAHRRAAARRGHERDLVVRRWADHAGAMLPGPGVPDLRPHREAGAAGPGPDRDPGRVASTTRRPSCAGSSATCTTAPRRGWSPSA